MKMKYAKRPPIYDYTMITKLRYPCESFGALSLQFVTMKSDRKEQICD